MTYTAWNGMEFETEDMVDLIQQTLQFMKREYRKDWLEGFPSIRIDEDGYYSVEHMSDKDITELFEAMVDSDTIDLADFFEDESTSIYGGW